jgi:hypothetical protein
LIGRNNNGDLSPVVNNKSKSKSYDKMRNKDINENNDLFKQTYALKTTKIGTSK